MTRSGGQRRNAAWLALIAMLIACPAAAQDSRQVRILVGSIGGTGPDFIARLIAPRLGDALHQTVIVDNRPSANGVLAGQLAARAPADGSVLMMGNAGTHAINAAIYRKLDYDPIADFAPISEIASIPLALVVHPSVPAKSVKELVALARRSPGKLNIAVMSGEADMTFTSYVVIASHVEAGRLRVLGVSSAERMPQLPDVSTIAENGLPGYEHEQWYALFAPAKTPAATIQALNREVVRIVNLPDVHAQLLKTGHRIVASTPQQLAEKVKREIEKTRRIVRESGMPQH